MNNCLGFLLIAGGLSGLFWIAVFNLGFYYIVRIFFPVSLSLAPLNQKFQVWVEVPLPIHITVMLTNVSSLHQMSGSKLGTGSVTLDLEMEPWMGGSKEVFPVLWIEEEASIDTLQRYLLTLTEGPWNYAKYVCWIVGLTTLFVGAIGAILLLLHSRKRNKIGM